MHASAMHSYPVFTAQERQGRSTGRRPGGRRRRRLVTLTLLFVLLVVGVMLLLPGTGLTLPRSRGVAVEAYTVAPGDSLWSIAAHYAGERDVRVIIEAIKETNHLPTAMLRPGQQLMIPLPNN